MIEGNRKYVCIPNPQLRIVRVSVSFYGARSPSSSLYSFVGVSSPRVTRKEDLQILIIG